MNWLIIVLRLIHILFGVFWAGSIFFIVSFMLPTARAAGPAGAPFMQRFSRAGFVNAAIGSGALSSLAGFALMPLVSGGQSSWYGSPMGIAISIGALTALVALGMGVFVQRPTMARMAVIAVAVEAAGGTPTAEQMAELPALQARMSSVARIAAWLLGITVVCMAVARYV